MERSDQKSSRVNERKEMVLLPVVSRRFFLKGTGALVAAAGAGIGAACGNGGREPSLSPGVAPLPEDEKWPEVPSAPATPAEADGKLQFLQPNEAQALDALTSRMMPGDPSDPGAHEAGVLYYIDYLLASTKGNNGWPEPHYSAGPFAKPYDGSTPPGPDTADTVWVAKSELPRYGYQSRLNPQQVFRQGLAQLDGYATSKFGKSFAALSESDQDTIIGALADGSATGFDSPDVDTFWSMVYDYTIQGMFCDPLYGGNRDYAGWKLVGYPGAQRAYTPHDLKTPGTSLAVQGLCLLPPLAAGGPGENSIIHPVSGSYQYPGNQPAPEQYSGNP